MQGCSGRQDSRRGFVGGRMKRIVERRWESCRVAAERMAVAGVGRVVIVKADDPTQVIGIITRRDLLKPRARVSEEMKRNRPLLPGVVELDGIEARQ